MNQREIDHQIKEFKASNHWHWMVKNDILWVPNTNVVYTACSKNACSQIKKNLARYNLSPSSFEGSPHNCKDTGLLGVVTLQSPKKISDLLFGKDTFRFAFARNPFERAVSAFSNRVDNYGRESYDVNVSAQLAHEENRKKIYAWNNDISMSNVPRNFDVSFADFIRFICDQDAYEMDRHWYFQTRTMHLDFMNYNFIGKVENLNQDIEVVIDKLPQKNGFSWSKTKLNTSQKPKDIFNNDFFTPDLLKIFSDRFIEDFDSFEYSTRIEKLYQSKKIEKKTKAVSDQEIQKSDKAPLLSTTVLITGSKYSDEIYKTYKSINNSFNLENPIIIFFEGNETFFTKELANYNDVVWINSSSYDQEVFNDFLSQTTSDFLLQLQAGSVVYNRQGYTQAIFSMQSSNGPIMVGGRTRYISLNGAGRIDSKNFQSHAGFLADEMVDNNLLTIPIEYSDIFETGLEGAYIPCDFLGTNIIYKTGKLIEALKKTGTGLPNKRLDQICWFQNVKNYHSRSINYSRNVEVEIDITNNPISNSKYPERQSIPQLWQEAPPSVISETGSKNFYFDKSRQDYCVLPFTLLDVEGNSSNMQAGALNTAHISFNSFKKEKVNLKSTINNNDKLVLKLKKIYIASAKYPLLFKLLQLPAKYAKRFLKI